MELMSRLGTAEYGGQKDSRTWAELAEFDHFSPLPLTSTMLSRSTRSLQRCWHVRRLQTAADVVDGPPATEMNRKHAHLPSLYAT